MASFNTNYFYGVVTFVMTLLTVIGNVMIITAFIIESSLRLRSSNLLVLALSVSDLVYGAYLFVYYGITIVFGLGHPFGEIGCKACVFLEYTFTVSTVLLLSISIDRVLLVSLNYARYIKVQSASRIKLTIVMCCMVGIVGACVEIGMWDYAKRNNEVAAGINFDLYCLYPPRRMKWFGLSLSFILYVLPVLLIGILSCVFFILLHKRIQQTRQIGSSVRDHSQSVATETRSIASVSQPNQEGGSPRNRYMKPAITLAALVSSMTITLFPFCIYLIIAAIRPELNDPDLIYTMLLICQFNPLLDPIFYGATQPQIREFYLKHTRKIWGRVHRNP